MTKGTFRLTGKEDLFCNRLRWRKNITASRCVHRPVISLRPARLPVSFRFIPPFRVSCLYLRLRFATLRAVACGNVVSLTLDPNLYRRFSTFPLERRICRALSPVRHRGEERKFGGGGGIIRRRAAHPSGRCLRQRCLAYVRPEPLSKVLNLPPWSGVYVWLYRLYGIAGKNGSLVVGEGLFAAGRLTLRAVACGNVVSLTLDPNLYRRFSTFPPWGGV
jgi:hypothetical protein